MATRLTKSDFLDWKACPKSFWLVRNRPQDFQSPPPSEFDRFLMEDGYAVESLVAEHIGTWDDAASFNLQVEFETDAGLFARADIIRENSDGTVDLYEVKGSTSLKGADGSDHLVDAAFQKAVIEAAGQGVRKVYVVHVRKDYVRGSQIDTAALLHFEEVTKAVAQIEGEVSADIVQALGMLQSEAIEEEWCACRLKGSIARHCVAFDHLNRDIPDKRIYMIPRISEKRLRALDKEGRLSIDKVEVGEVTASQAPVLEALQSGEPVIDHAAVAKFIDGLDWPLWFYDYETFASAIPIAQGHMPHQQMPVQFSLHRLDEDGALTHFEYLSEKPGDQQALVEHLKEMIGEEGSLIAWNKSFEMGCNRRMAELLPAEKAFLDDLNARTQDLMDIFKTDWVDPGFEGSTSIKKVLPVLVPQMRYSDDAVHDGAGAILAWKEMVETGDADRKQRLGKELTDYCQLDTLAMVEIFRHVKERV